MSKHRIAYTRVALMPYWVGIAFDEKSFQNELKELGIKEPVCFVKKDATALTLGSSHGLTIIITLDIKEARKRKLVEVIGLLVHECVHAWQSICREMGEDAPGREVEAYAVQCLSQWAVGQFLEAKCKKAGRA